MPPSIYYPKVIGIDGTVIAAPLDVANVQFTQTAYVNGQPNPGSFELTLIPTWDAKYRRGMYNTLLPEQRVEIYDNRDLLGDPVFTGVLRRRSNNLAGERIVKGDDVTRRLDSRKLRAYQQLTGNAAALIRGLLKTYNVSLSDSFDSSFAAFWDTTTNWSVISGMATKHTNLTGNLGTNTRTSAEWDNVKISFDFQMPDWHTVFFRFPRNAAGDALEVVISRDPSITLNAADTEAYYDVRYIIGVNSYLIAKRFFWFIPKQLFHCDLYTSVSSLGRQVVFTVNGLEVLNITDSSGNSVAGTFQIYTDVVVGQTGNYKVDNFIFAPATAALAPGTITTTGVTIDQQFNGDSQLKAIQWICDYLGWTYRIRPKAGAGNDLFDCGLTVGHDWTNGGLVLQEGQNLESLNIDESFDNIATLLQVYGQSRDDVTSGFISTKLSAMVTYGIVEQDYSDQRVISSDIAKIVGDARLTILSAGNVSLQGRVKNEFYLYKRNAAIWDTDTWDSGAIYDGRAILYVGDIVPVKSDDLNINRNATIVSLTKRSGDTGLDLVFDYHGWTASMLMQRLGNQIASLQRSIDQKLDSQGKDYTMTGTTPLTLSFNMRGNLYKAVYLDVTSASWAGAVTLAIDTTDRTAALFGAATLTANAFAKDTTWLIFSGVHTITLTPTQTVTVTVGIRPILMG